MLQSVRTESATQRPAREPTEAEPLFNYLMLSDVHLGSDIVPHLRPWATSSWLTREAEVDEQLVGMLEHYRRDTDSGRPWRLVIAGDFLDLVGVSIAAHAGSLRTAPTREEELHGLGSASDHVVRKVEVIAARHPRVFCALMEFLAAGHSLVLVRGNHDVELHWRAAQQAFVAAVVEHAPREERAVLASRIEICPWFFAVEGLLYVEHGHEFDGMCSYGDPLLPTCLRDPRRIRSTPFSVLLRHVARPTRGLSTTTYGYVGMGAYCTLVMKLGLLNSALIALRFARAAFRLISECFARGSNRGRFRALVAQARHRRFLAHMRVDPHRVAALAALYVTPAARSLRFVVRSLYLDRILCLLLAFACTTGGALSAHYQSSVTSLPYLLPALLLAAYAAIGSGSNTSPSRRMRDGAREIAKLFDARWVVMGHTHEPCIDRLEPERSYVNLGSWGEDELPDERAAPNMSPCTYLVLRHDGSDYSAKLLRWDRERGPRPFCMETEEPGADDVLPVGSMQPT